MNQHPTNALPSQLGVRPSAELTAALLTQAFVWMFAGLLVTGIVTAFVYNSPSLLEFAGENWLLLFFGQVGLAIGIQALMSRISALVALGLFFIYAATLGLTVGLIVSFYTEVSVATAFFSAATIFGAAAVYGAVTKRPLTKLSGFLGIALVGWLAAVVVNVIIGSGPLGYLIAIVTVVLFTVLTALDVQKIAHGDYAVALNSTEKASVLAALHLYISFMNIFLALLRIMGGRR
jgi:FtsH-binding integral membrane protein